LPVRPGDSLTFFNGRGGEHESTIVESRGGKLTVEVGEPSWQRGLGLGSGDGTGDA